MELRGGKRVASHAPGTSGASGSGSAGDGGPSSAQMDRAATGGDAAPSASSTTSLLDLPEEVLQVVVAHLGLPSRRRAAFRSCRALARAVTATACKGRNRLIRRADVVHCWPAALTDLILSLGNPIYLVLGAAGRALGAPLVVAHRWQPPPKAMWPLVHAFELSGLMIEERALAALKLHAWPHLTSLCITDCEFGYPDPEARLRGAFRHPITGLKVFHIHSDVPEWVQHPLTQLAGRVESLSVNTDGLLGGVAPHLQQLQHVHIRRGPLTSAGVRVLAPLRLKAVLLEGGLGALQPGDVPEGVQWGSLILKEGVQLWHLRHLPKSLLPTVVIHSRLQDTRNAALRAMGLVVVARSKRAMAPVMLMAMSLATLPGGRRACWMSLLQGVMKTPQDGLFEILDCCSPHTLTIVLAMTRNLAICSVKWGAPDEVDGPQLGDLMRRAHASQHSNLHTVVYWNARAHLLSCLPAHVTSVVLCAHAVAEVEAHGLVAALPAHVQQLVVGYTGDAQAWSAWQEALQPRAGLSVSVRAAGTL